MPTIDHGAVTLYTTDELVAYWTKAALDLPSEQVAEAIPAGIDALYANRDAGGNMHSAGAACVVTALRAAKAIERA